MKKKRKKIIIMFTIFVALIVLSFLIINKKNSKIGAYVTYDTQRCLCDIGEKHSHYNLSFNYDEDNKTMQTEFICVECNTVVAVVNVTSYPANLLCKVSTFTDNEQSLNFISMKQYAGSEPRIFEEIKALSGYSNVNSIVYEDSIKNFSVFELYEYSDWTKTVIDTLGNYIANTYNISFEPSGATGIMESIKFISGQLPECTYMKDGYLFAGWSLKDNSVPEIEDKAWIEINKNITLYACWIENPYELGVESEDINKGSAMIDKLYGRTLTIISKPEIGYTFSGWYESDELVSNEEVYTFTLPERDLKLVARFIPTSNSVKIIDGGTNYKGDYEECDAGSNVEISAGTRIGYEFSEWGITRGNVLLDNITSSDTFFIMPEGDVVLTASWKEIKGISASVNNTFNALYGSSNYFNGVCYDIDKGITVKSNMISVFIEYTNGSMREVDKFTMEPYTLSQIGSNNIPISLEISGLNYSTEVIIQGYSSTLFRLMTAAGIDIDSFQELIVLIGSIQSSLLYSQNNLNTYDRQLDDLSISNTDNKNNHIMLLNKLDSISMSLETLASQLTDCETKITSVTQQTRTLIANYKDTNSQAIADAFANLGQQIKKLTDQVLVTSDKQKFVKDKYIKVKNKIS